MDKDSLKHFDYSNVDDLALLCTKSVVLNNLNEKPNFNFDKFVSETTHLFLEAREIIISEYLKN